MAHLPLPIGTIEASLGKRSWQWRGGNMDLGEGGGLEDDLVTALLLSRGVDRADLERHRAPSLRNFLPDPAIFHDMEKAAQTIVHLAMIWEERA